jgi:hypothetical protein
MRDAELSKHGKDMDWGTMLAIVLGVMSVIGLIAIALR